jgi:hypothetical protein
MTEKTLFESLLEIAPVCGTCKYFTELEGGFYCTFLEAFLSEQILDVPCEFKENIE